jgi:hypothetical protein
MMFLWGYALEGLPAGLQLAAKWLIRGIRTPNRWVASVAVPTAENLANSRRPVRRLSLGESHSLQEAWRCKGPIFRGGAGTFWSLSDYVLGNA